VILPHTYVYVDMCICHTFMYAMLYMYIWICIYIYIYTYTYRDISTRYNNMTVKGNTPSDTTERKAAFERREAQKRYFFLINTQLVHLPNKRTTDIFTV
jgi:hypothetical protein